MKTYVKRPLTTEDLDEMRISLSVQPRTFGSEPVCDFCGEPTPVCIYGASRMSTGEPRSCWRWCACARCERLVDSGDFETMQATIAAWLGKRLGHVPNGVIAFAAKQAFEEFFLYAEVR